MDEGCVQVAGAAMKPSYRVEPGDTRHGGNSGHAPPAGVEAEPIPLDVLYEDEDLAVINKPAGMIIHPGAGAQSRHHGRRAARPLRRR